MDGSGESMPLGMSGHHPALLDGRRAEKDETEQGLGPRVAGRCQGEPGGDPLGLMENEGIVFERQGLHGSRRFVAHRHELPAVGDVEGIHERIGDGAEDEAVDRPAAMRWC